MDGLLLFAAMDGLLLFAAMDGLLLFAVLTAAVIGWLLIRQTSLPSRKERPSPVKGVPMHEWQHLLKICLGDRQRAMRLLRAEQERNPHLSPRQACRIAIERYVGDNR